MEAYEMYPNDIDDIAEVVNHYTAIMEKNNELTEREKNDYIWSTHHFTLQPATME